ncbi:HlyD family type I secretion periplasmic adaptor subunit [Pectobacterium brasiliense]|uniref:HlyD family type I secretion periplasmic adaptor subunit n=1 Tax=Pectobacterium brasiliense TaxID=180957 RepID=UPI001CE1B5EF|nr:HlyD family type I secretion periplasmic adaptor subunit [Pectobacterium brasiliense]MCA5918426.1 HlyD family type I secretion periplasmic adaptor subunit [Pectobacterium brasiliense]MCA5926035.1 HlyD family type I secretion periplasmic adaptor subunit [Pectobacterium brasiliense]MCA5934290.1 HlyD family type I secretion periplasmic adaptor subunit [Pectobacterium brasiliense]MCA5938472.1 HlyD family type I secretion periplasmic adaptor subunit [Pectobacterium brasiliense]MCA5943940.1 HlyD 
MSALREVTSQPTAPLPQVADNVAAMPLHTDAGRYLKYGLWLVLAGFGGLLLWASMAPLDKGVAVSGRVVVADNRKVVQPVSSGRIASLTVRDGDRVQAGQVLATLDQTPAQAQRDNLITQLQEAFAGEARLLAERDDLNTIAFPAPTEQHSTVTQQIQIAHQQLFISRRAALQQERAAIQAAIIGAKAQSQGSQALLASSQTQFQIINEQLRGLRPLAQEGYIARNRLLDVERQAAQLAGAIAQERNNQVQLQQQVVELEQKIQQRQNEYQKEVRSQLADTQRSIQDLTQRLKTAEYELQHTHIRAPASGTVVGLALHTEGGVVNSGQMLMEIVPEGQPLLIDAQLPIELVDRVSNGLPVELLFSAFNQSTTPRISGVVALIGADQLVEQQTGKPYYALRIHVDEQGKQQLAGLDVRPGMPVQAFIRTGERSLLNYLFKPLSDRLHLALTEE